MWFLALLSLLISSVSSAQQTTLLINVAHQKMYVKHHGKIIKSYPISTAFLGIGSKPNSFQTPLGKHRIVQKIGDNALKNTIFKTGINTHKCATVFAKPIPYENQVDSITSRIFQLEGLEPHNRTSFPRGIWVHGTPYEGNIGTPSSHGCIRMRNKDIIELYPQIKVGTILSIVPA